MDDFVLIDDVILKSLQHSRRNNVIRYFHRNVIEFKKGETFDDENADYVIQKCKHTSKGQNAWGGVRTFQKLFVRRTVIDKWLTRIQLQIKRKPAENNLVYFIHEEGDLAQFKIGFTTKLEERVSSLQTGNPRNLVTY